MPMSLLAPFHTQYNRYLMLEASQLSCERGHRLLFDGISFQLESGGLLRVSGPNGSGKTSLLRIVCGLISPLRGRLAWKQKPMTVGNEAALDIRYTGHLTGLSEELSARENLAFYAAMARVKAATTIDHALARLELAQQADLPVRWLSQGQKRRVALARLVLEPAPLWVLDEPFTALDQSAIEIVQGLIEEHLAAGNMALISTHQEVPIRARSVQRIRLGA